MTKTITDFAKQRHTVKAYDPARKISAADLEKIKELLRFSASSVNSQPWHFVLAGTDEGKARIAKSAAVIFPANVPVIEKASHAVVFAAKLDLDQAYEDKLLAQEEQDGRFDVDPDTFKSGMKNGRNFFLNIHRHDQKDLQHWMEKQVYLNLGGFLLGVAALGIDATPMEGIDPKTLDEQLGLREQGYTSLVVVTLGYRDPDADYNGTIPKSRLPYTEILSEI